MVVIYVDVEGESALIGSIITRRDILVGPV